jgi:pyridoxamine 5'-phosphate oxidase
MTDPRFEGEDPVGIFARWLDEAAAVEPRDPNAIALATVDGTGMPNVRIVLLKEIGPDGLVFYTNYESRKGEELTRNPSAAFVCYWKSLGRQVRVRGNVVREEGPIADAYFASRPRQSQLGAWASIQSETLDSREAFETRMAEVEARFAGTDVPRPDGWSGYRVAPEAIEFWYGAQFRLHERWRYECDAAGAWSKRMLFP